MSSQANIIKPWQVLKKAALGAGYICRYPLCVKKKKKLDASREVIVLIAHAKLKENVLRSH